MEGDAEEAAFKIRVEVRGGADEIVQVEEGGGAERAVLDDPDAAGRLLADEETAIGGEGEDAGRADSRGGDRVLEPGGDGRYCGEGGGQEEPKRKCDGSDGSNGAKRKTREKSASRKYVGLRGAMCVPP